MSCVFQKRYFPGNRYSFCWRMNGVNGNQLFKKPVPVHILHRRNKCESMEKLDKRMKNMPRVFGYPRTDARLYKNYPHNRVPKKILNSLTAIPRGSIAPINRRDQSLPWGARNPPTPRSISV